MGSRSYSQDRSAGIGTRPKRGLRTQLRSTGESRQLGKTTQIIFRVRPEKKQQLLRPAEALSAGKAIPISMTETMEQALDALEARLKRKVSS